MITPEADRAIFRVQMRYAMVAFSLSVLGIVGFAIVTGKNLHNPVMMHAMRNQPLFLAVACLWVIPFLIGQAKQSALRLQYGRQFAQEQRWTTVVAALRSFMEWGQRSFDRDGEAHFLLAQAYDRLGRKEQARKAREFIRKHRKNSEWARRIGSVPGASAARPVINRAKKPASESVSASSAAVLPEAAAKRAGQPLAKPGRRRRF